MAMLKRYSLLLAIIASPVTALVTQRKSSFADLEFAVRQRLYANMRARVPDTKSSPMMMMRARHGLQHTEEKVGEISAEELSIVDGLSGEALGSAASLSEDGYKAVANAKSRAAMQAFVMRVLDREGLAMTKPNDLQGVLPYYDGECATQNLDNLIRELRDGTAQHGCRAPWITRKDGTALLQESLETSEVRSHWNTVTSEGAFAPLNEEGYQAVAAKHDNHEMAIFIERVMRRDGLKVNNTNGLAGFVPYYSGECATQSFEALVADIHCVGPAAVTANVTYQFSATDAPSVEQLRQSIASAAGVDEKVIVISDLVDATHTADASAAKAEAHIKKQDVPIMAPLSEEGYQQVAALKDDKAMLIFIRRQLDAFGIRAKTQADMHGFVGWFSGNISTQSYDRLVSEILTKQLPTIPNDKSGTYAAAAAAAAAAKKTSPQVLVKEHVTPTLLKNPAEKKPAERKPEKTSKTLKMSITTEDATVLSHIRKAVKNITDIQAHFDAFDADVNIEVTPDFDVVSITPSACGGGWVTAA